MKVYLTVVLMSLFGCLSVESLEEIPYEHNKMINQQSYRVLGIGAAIMDLLIAVDERFLQFVPGEKGGCALISDKVLDDLIKLSGANPRLATGGSCANTIKGLAGLGTSCALLSHVGPDELGDHFRTYMKKKGVLPLFFQSSLPTARVLCLITPDGQRTMRSYLGSSHEMSEYDLHKDYFKDVSIVHLDSYCLRNGKLVEHALRMAKECGAKVSLDLSSFEIVREFKLELLDLLREYVDIVFANEDETLALTNCDLIEGCKKLHEMCEIAIVLRGKDGCIVACADKITSHATFPAHVVDTTGAGDLFASGFLYGYLNGYSINRCAELGNRLGSSIVEVTGAELPEAALENIKREFINY